MRLPGVWCWVCTPCEDLLSLQNTRFPAEWVCVQRWRGHSTHSWILGRAASRPPFFIRTLLFQDSHVFFLFLFFLTPLKTRETFPLWFTCVVHCIAVTRSWLKTKD